MPTCYHKITSSQLCDLCGIEVPPEARGAAYLRGAFSDSTGPCVVAHGVSTLTLVHGDEVKEIDIEVRPRRQGEAGASMLVAEIKRGARFADGLEFQAGALFPVAVREYQLATAPTAEEEK